MNRDARQGTGGVRNNGYTWARGRADVTASDESLLVTERLKACLQAHD